MNKFIISLICIILLTKCFIFSDDLLNTKDKISTKKAIVVVDKLNFRSEFNIGSKSIGTLNTGDIVDVIEIVDKKVKINDMEDYWYKVKYNNKEGFIFGYFISEFNNNHIVKNEKNGIILFLKNDSILISKVEYNSYYITAKRINSGEKLKNEAKIVDIINDNFALIKTINFYYVGSEYLISNYTLYNKQGEKLIYEQGMPFTIFSQNLNFLILNKATLDQNNNSKFLNEIEIYSANGKQIKKLSTKMKTSYKDEFNLNEILLNNNGDKYIWVNSSNAMILDLKKLKIKYKDFKEIEKYDPKKTFINLQKVEIKSNKLIVELLPFNFIDGIDYDIITITIDI